MPGLYLQQLGAGGVEQERNPVQLHLVRVPPSGWPGQVPYVLGQVELPEGPQVLAEVIECPESDLKIGLPVELALLAVRTSDEESERVVYKWRPA